jgi:hypothetical protein
LGGWGDRAAGITLGEVGEGFLEELEGRTIGRDG